jgi:hypothetical protein
MIHCHMCGGLSAGRSASFLRACKSKTISKTSGLETFAALDTNSESYSCSSVYKPIYKSKSRYCIYAWILGQAVIFPLAITPHYSQCPLRSASCVGTPPLADNGLMKRYSQ